LRLVRLKSNDGRVSVFPGRVPLRLLVAIWFVVAATSARAAEPDSAWLVRVWKMSEGLAGNNIAGIVEAKDGFLWTLAGGELVRFDGVKFTHVPVESFAGPPARKIREFTQTRDGGLAFGLFDGTIVRVGAGKVTITPPILPHNQLRLEALSESDDGGLLAVFNDESVWLVRGDEATRITENDGLPPGAHCRFTTDQAGHLWFAKGDYVGVKRGEKFETLHRFSDTHVRVAAARDGGVWIGAGSRLLRFGEGRRLEEIAELPLKNVPVRPTILLEDRKGAVWFGTYASGLFRFDGSRFASVPISHRQPVSLTEDREGSMWVGTSGGGLNQVQPRTMTLEGDETGVPYQAVQALAEDERDHLWAVTQNGLLATRQDGGWKTSDEIKPDGEVRCIAAEPSGALWIGTKNGSLQRWSEGRLTTWGRTEGISAQGPVNLIVGRNGDLWIGSSRPGGIQRLRNGRLETFELPQPATIVRAMTEDAAGDMWIAASGKQMVRISHDQLIDESARFASVGPNVHLLQATPDGALWIGYEHGGIARFKSGSFGRITTHEGLPHDNIEFMLPDNRGWMWIAAGESIFKVSQRELVNVAEGRSTQVQPVRYGHDQGVRPVFGATVGALLRRDGKLWLPMATSLAIIDPALERPLTDPPPVWIVEVRVDGRVVAAHGGIFPVAEGVEVATSILSLAPDHRRLDLDFTALSFRTPSNVQFRYRLDHFDDRWIDAGSRRSISYSRLHAGDYRFRVQACSSDGVWNETGATFAFIVKPFFTETWWFRGAAIMAFAGLVFGVTRTISVRRLREKLRAARQETALERERARIARDIHDDLGGRLTQIVLLSGLVARDRAAPEKVSERVEEISETARQLIKSLDETVWTVNPRNDTLPHLISYIGQFAVNFLRTAEITCNLDVPDDPPPLPVSAELRHNLLLAVKEALTNVVRHARATRVVFRARLTTTSLELRIEDNGQGLRGTAEAPGADGLQNMRQRLTQIGGRCEIQSNPGAGTHVSLILPCPRPK
jgi:signal transduction histidine kinase/ligand-binding sensor domain-containing protein